MHSIGRTGRRVLAAGAPLLRGRSRMRVPAGVFGGVLGGGWGPFYTAGSPGVPAKAGVERRDPWVRLCCCITPFRNTLSASQ